MRANTDIRQPDLGELLTTRQAIAETGFSRSTLDRARRDGLLSFYTVGRRGVRFTRADLELWATPRPTNPPGRQPRPRRPRDERGFTLVELLVVVIIIGILAAIAVPVFLNQKAKAYDSAVKSDLNAVAKAVETALTDGPGAISRSGDTVVVTGGGTAPVTTSPGVTWDVTGSPGAYCAIAWRSDERGRYLATTPLVYDSTAGGITSGTCGSATGAPPGWTTGGATGGGGGGGTGGGGTPSPQPSIVLAYDTTALGCTDSSITLPVAGVVDTAGTIAWGDGSSTPLTIFASHTYAAPGAYSVSVYGTFTALSGASLQLDAPCLTGVPTWAADAGTTSATLSFYGATNLSFVAAPPLTVTNVTGMFRGSSFNGDISGWNTSNVTNMTQMFTQAVAFNGDISGWNTSMVTNMGDMFYGASAFNRDLSGWDVSKVTSHANFASGGAGALTQPHWVS